MYYFYLFFFFFRTVKFNCSVSAHILIRDGKMSHSKQTVTKPDWKWTSSSLQSISGYSTGSCKQRCSAGGEAQKDFMIFVVLALMSTPLHLPARWIASGHLTSTLVSCFSFQQSSCLSLIPLILIWTLVGERERKCTWMFTHAAMFAVPSVGRPERRIN